MGKFIKNGRVVIMLNGRQAGKKAVVVRVFEEGTKERPFGHALVAGVASYPKRITKDMSKKKQAKKTKVKPFVRFVNFNHLMPTRYTLSKDIDFKSVVTDEKMSNPEARKEMRKAVKASFEDKYKNQSVKKEKEQSNVGFFFKKLRF
mmetsp:Transcript_1402/g.1472  ORF Transcript_1402/g.1472 Transcript_1402/m.1472 type:complete len:147 (-) Transcript_1402:351-791(-)|eukprot:CAMPEP_0115007506 /NCGR_PEP_ID=MMETSP0216-20121206/21235_1 /TAXON_ID=223996 /ORGANISM="Protocruzia adherens, Strain Boccale" /LENGTH=146 /DNA_ID=CAMNT_0002374491 /DNA_START=55 /DNA_END=495 /DNA_ORIENTATION=+